MSIERDNRAEARRSILAAANRYINARKRTEPLNARQIQQAVCIVRQWGLVKPDVLVAAGYRAESRRKAQNRTLVPTAKQRREIAEGEAWGHPSGVTSGVVDRPRTKRRAWPRPWWKVAS